MEQSPQQILTIGDVTFDRVEYSARVDELNCWIGPTRPIVGIDETPEDHFLRFDADGELYQFFVYPARELLRQDGQLAVTLPGRATVVLTREQVEPLLVDPHEEADARALRRRDRRDRWRRRLGVARVERLLSRSGAGCPRPSSPRRPRPPASRSGRRP